ncbi:hypothetical protein HELRODRAFT_167527 [Helobdella robusta]|uniref:Neuron navigator 1-like ubiquitin-like domain-containing protein n=1 Tax=Helobdella robusta TaxID=6412 RepID=T1EZG4_HELRO|nr:hypothetical protein HELRODRAFT_167527 [Helobdella robusta]ESO11008.1 hypothetical protein HELRODRAFT_167527 [Helobdella robusta]
MDCSEKVVQHQFHQQQQQLQQQHQQFSQQHQQSYQYQPQNIQQLQHLQQQNQQHKQHQHLLKQQQQQQILNQNQGKLQLQTPHNTQNVGEVGNVDNICNINCMKKCTNPHTDVVNINNNNNNSVGCNININSSSSSLDTDDETNMAASATQQQQPQQHVSTFFTTSSNDSNLATKHKPFPAHQAVLDALLMNRSNNVEKSCNKESDKVQNKRWSEEIVTNSKQYFDAGSKSQTHFNTSRNNKFNKFDDRNNKTFNNQQLDQQQEFKYQQLLQRYLDRKSTNFEKQQQQQHLHQQQKSSKKIFSYNHINNVNDSNIVPNDSKAIKATRRMFKKFDDNDEFMMSPVSPTAFLNSNIFFNNYIIDNNNNVNNNNNNNNNNNKDNEKMISNDKTSNHFHYRANYNKQHSSNNDNVINTNKNNNNNSIKIINSNHINNNNNSNSILKKSKTTTATTIPPPPPQLSIESSPWKHTKTGSNECDVTGKTRPAKHAVVPGGSRSLTSGFVTIARSSRQNESEVSSSILAIKRITDAESVLKKFIINNNSSSNNNTDNNINNLNSNIRLSILSSLNNTNNNISNNVNNNNTSRDQHIYDDVNIYSDNILKSKPKLPNSVTSPTKDATFGQDNLNFFKPLNKDLISYSTSLEPLDTLHDSRCYGRRMSLSTSQTKTGMGEVDRKQQQQLNDGKPSVKKWVTPTTAICCSPQQQQHRRSESLSYLMTRCQSRDLNPTATVTSTGKLIPLVIIIMTTDVNDNDDDDDDDDDDNEVDGGDADDDDVGEKIIDLGSMLIGDRTTWESLDDLVVQKFKEYCLSREAYRLKLLHYTVGEIRRKLKTLTAPELLPIGYLVGDVTSLDLVVRRRVRLNLHVEDYICEDNKDYKDETNNNRDVINDDDVNNNTANHNDDDDDDKRKGVVKDNFLVCDWLNGLFE